MNRRSWRSHDHRAFKGFVHKTVPLFPSIVVAAVAVVAVVAVVVVAAVVDVMCRQLRNVGRPLNLNLNWHCFTGRDNDWESRFE